MRPGVYPLEEKITVAIYDAETKEEVEREFDTVKVIDYSVTTPPEEDEAYQYLYVLFTDLGNDSYVIMPNFHVKTDYTEEFYTDTGVAVEDHPFV